MALNAATLAAGADHMMSLMPYGAIHTAQPDASGSNQASGAGRVALSWDTSTNGNLTLTTDETFTGGTPGSDAKYLGLWSASSGGTFRGWYQLVGSQVFDGAGEYLLTAIDIPASAV